MKHGKQIRKKKRIKNNQGGFTLAELLIVLGILAILLSIGMIALVHYQRSLKLTEMDSSAKEIFVAAQNHITAAKASGKWSELSSMHSSDAEAYFGSRMQNAPSDYPYEAALPENGEGNGH